MPPPPRPSPVRVLLADRAQHLAELALPLFSGPGPELVPSGPACDFEGLFEAVKAQSPNVILLDFGLTAADALDAVERVMARCPTPILALYASKDRSADAFQALGLGVLDVEGRPAIPTEAYWRDLAKRIILLSQVRVVRHVKGARPARKEEALAQRVVEQVETPAPFPVVAIAASLGGPQALAALLRLLPHAFPAPILICQHISTGFTGGLAQWLAFMSGHAVREAKQREGVRAGTVYIAPSGVHFTVTSSGQVNLDSGPAVQGFKPSCDALLSSVAVAFRSRAIGVVLTGMGRDGARGLLEVRRNGGRTIAQAEEGCTVFSMPREAIALGAAEAVLPLEQIAGALEEWVVKC